MKIKERLAKFAIMIVIIPFLWFLLAVIGLIIIILPAVALRSPEKIKIKGLSLNIGNKGGEQ